MNELSFKNACPSIANGTDSYPKEIGDARDSIARLNADGAYWTSFQKSNTDTAPFVFAYKRAVNGDNALIVSQTAGLQFICSAQRFGIQNHASNVHFRNVKFSNYSTLIIPKLKQGQYVLIWWNPYAGKSSVGSGSGATFSAKDLTDLDDNDIDTKFAVTLSRKCKDWELVWAKVALPIIRQLIWGILTVTSEVVKLTLLGSVLESIGVGAAIFVLFQQKLNAI